MADANGFEALCAALEESTSLDRLEARGTVRLALKEAGLDPRSATSGQLGVVVEKVLPTELHNRGIEPDEALRAALRSGLENVIEDAAETPESVFARLGG